jgi:uncharacterized protein (TIGR00730 family)
MKRRIITVFGSSRPRAEDAQYVAAQALGAELARKGFTVCSGGYGGVMEAVSRGAKDAGGNVLGITAKFFKARVNQWVDKEIRMKTWQDRLFELIKRGHGYVVCPGGTGTLVEVAVVWEMLNKGVMAKKPLVMLGGFWQPMIERVREIELGHDSPWSEKTNPLIHFASSPADAAAILVARFDLRTH